MRRAWKIVTIAATLVVALAVAGIATLLSLDFNQYRGLIADRITEATGRRLTIAGDLHLKLSLTPSLAVEGVKLANAGWGSRPDMLKLGKLEAEVQLLPLLSGDIRINRLVLSSVHALLETDAEGRSNWDFAAGREGGEKVGGQGLLPVVREVRIEDATVAYRDGPSGRLATLRLGRLDARAESLDQPLQLSLEADYDGLALKGRGQLGSIRALLAGDRPWPISFKAEGVGVEARIEGTIAEPRALAGLDLGLAVSGASLGRTAAALGPVVPALAKAALPGLGRFEASARITGSREKLAVTGLQASVEGPGAAVVTARGGIADASHLAGLDVTLSAKGGDVAGAFEAIRAKVPGLQDVALPPLGPYAIEADIKGSLERLSLSRLRASVGRKGETLVAVGGRVGNVTGLTGLDLTLAFESADLAALARPLGADLPALPPVRFEGRLVDRDGGYAAEGVTASLGASDLAGRLTLSLAGERPRLGARLRSRRVDLAALLPAVGQEEKKAEKKAERKAEKARLFPDDPLPVEGLRRLDADVSWTVDRLALPRGIVWSPVTLEATLAGARLSIRRFDAGVLGGRLNARLALDATGAVPSLNAHVRGREIPLGEVLRRYGLTDLLEGGKIDLAFDGEGRGRSVREIMAGLDGELRVQVGPGRFHNPNLDLLGAGLQDLIGGINPFAGRDEYSSVRCAVVRFEIKDGMANSDNGLALETEKMNVMGSGTVNLKTEKMDLAIKPMPAQGGLNLGGSLVRLIRIRGTLADPDYTLDRAGVASTAAEVGMALATSGLSLLAQALINSQSTITNPCAVALGKAPAAATPPKPETGTDAPDDKKGVVGGVTGAVGGAVKGVTEGIGKSLQGLFGNGK